MISLFTHLKSHLLPAMVKIWWLYNKILDKRILQCRLSTGVLDLSHQSRQYQQSRTKSFNRNRVISSPLFRKTLMRSNVNSTPIISRYSQIWRDKLCFIWIMHQRNKKLWLATESDYRDIFQTHPPQQVVSVSAEQPSQPPILLQCRSSGLDLTTPTVQPTKLLPQPTVSNSEKEEVFAVPKVDI